MFLGCFFLFGFMVFKVLGVQGSGCLGFLGFRV